MASASALDIVGSFLLTDLPMTACVPQSTRVIEALAVAADVFEDEVYPMVHQAFAHCPESREAMRLANCYAGGKRIVRDNDVAELLEEIEGDAASLRDILAAVAERARLARVHKDWRAQYQRVAPHAVGAAMECNTGLAHFAADVLELLGYTLHAKRLRRGAAAVKPKEGGYAFHDPDYEDDPVSDSDDEEYAD